MDPQAAWDELCRLLPKIKSEDRAENIFAREESAIILRDLADWLDKGGFPWNPVPKNVQVR